MRLRKHTSFLFFSVAGILAMSWVVIGLQNRRIDENALKNAGKTGEEWLSRVESTCQSFCRFACGFMPRGWKRRGAGGTAAEPEAGATSANPASA